jgi:hypothetical protein
MGENIMPAWIKGTTSITDLGSSWLMEDTNTTETWPNPTDSPLPPLTLWKVGSLGSPAPTMTRYDSPLTQETVLGSEEVINGDMEAGVPVLGSTGYITTGASIALSTEQAHSGTQSLKVIDTNALAGAGTRFLDAGGLPALGAGTYEYEVWVYLPSGQTITGLRMAIMSGAGSVTTLDTTTVLDTWVMLSGTFTDVAAPQRVSWVYGLNDTNIGDFWYTDDISIKEVITAGNEFKRLTYADCLAIKPYVGGVVPKWQKPDDACLLKELAIWPNNQNWTLKEYDDTEDWRTELTEQCGAEPALWFPLIDGNGNVMIDDNGNELGYYL